MSSIDRPHVLQSGIRGPVTDWPFVRMFDHVGEASFGYHGSDPRLNIQFLACLQSTFNREFSGFVEGVAFNLGAVVGFGHWVDLALLEIAARFEVTVDIGACQPRGWAGRKMDITDSRHSLYNVGQSATLP